MHGRAVDFDAGSLRETSRVAIVIGTHAPGDTVIMTLGFDVEFDGAAHPAHLDLLLEPKSLKGYGDESEGVESSRALPSPSARGLDYQRVGCALRCVACRYI